MARVFGSLVMVFWALAAHAADKRFIVVLKPDSSPQKMERALTLKSDSILSAAALRIEKRLPRVNALVLRMDDRAVAALKARPGVAAVEEEVFHPAPPPIGGFRLSRPMSLKSSPQAVDPLAFHSGARTPWGIGAIHAAESWSACHAGQGARVLVLDTGIDQDHPSLAANFEKGQDFMSDANAPYAYADHVGHGTHVSGTIAAIADADGFTGVAPQSKILAGRVCSALGCSNVALAAGIDWGLSENVDVISMSLGGAWSTWAEREAVGRALAAGVTVVAASGNDGSGRVAYPAALGGVIAVGAVDDKLSRAEFSQYGPEVAVVAPGVNVVSSVPRGTGRESEVQATVGEAPAQWLVSATFEGAGELSVPQENPVAFVGLGRPEDYIGLDVKGKFVLAERGIITFLDKARNAIDAGAAGLIVHNNVPGLIRGALTNDGSVLPIPVMLIEQAAGEGLRSALTAAQPVRLRLATRTTDYSPFDGTSMATPHVSGVVALMKSVNKALTPAQVREILRSTATPLAGPNANNEWGAGLVNAEAAVRAAAALRNPSP